MTSLKVATSRFGEVEISEEQVFSFPEGILGFPGIHRYFLLENPGGGPFLWLHAVESAHLAFVVVDPALFKPDYQVRVRAQDLENIELTDIKDGRVYVILVIPTDPRQMTANLQGPIVLNLKKHLGKQLVLTGAAEYSTKHPVFAGADRAAAPAAARPDDDRRA